MNYEVKDFSSDVLQASYDKPILVDFWAEWCGPCRILGPVLEQLAAKSEDWNLAKVNSDEYPELAAKYGIRSIPNVKLFYKGEVINEFVGALPEHAIKDWLKKNIPNKFHDMLAHAEAILMAGNENEAQKILEEILKQDNQNAKAKLLMARILLFKDSQKALEMINNVEVNNGTSDLIESINIIAELLDNKNSDLEESPAKNLYIKAISYLKEKKFSQALEKFIEIIRIDRYYADDVARKACVAIFKYLGEENEITLKYRRDFGSALYI
jgi:putative thioredoxin